MWLVETRYTIADERTAPHGFAGFTEVERLTEDAIVASLRAAYPGIGTSDIELTLVEARNRKPIQHGERQA
jgi:hypothetical protein